MSPHFIADPAGRGRLPRAGRELLHQRAAAASTRASTPSSNPASRRCASRSTARRRRPTTPSAATAISIVLVRNLERLVERRDAAGFATPRAAVPLRDDAAQHPRDRRPRDARRVARRDRAELLATWWRSTGSAWKASRSRTTKPSRTTGSNGARGRGRARASTCQFHPPPFDLRSETSPAARRLPRWTRPFLPTPYCAYPFFHVSIGPGGHVLAVPVFTRRAAVRPALRRDAVRGTSGSAREFTTLRAAHPRATIRRTCAAAARTSPTVIPTSPSLFATSTRPNGRATRPKPMRCRHRRVGRTGIWAERRRARHRAAADAAGAPGGRDARARLRAGRELGAHRARLRRRSIRWIAEAIEHDRVAT